MNIRISRAIDAQETTGIRQGLEADGFVHVRTGLVPGDLNDVERLLDARAFGSHRLLDLAGIRREHGLIADRPRQIEVVHLLWFERRLRRSAVFAACSEIARSVLGAAYCTYDHLIYKMPGSETVTGWHQDEAYAPRRPGVDLHRLHFWIPLNDVSPEGGAMQYVPGSHREGMRDHHDERGRSAKLKVTGQPDADRILTAPACLGDVLIHVPRTVHGAGINRLPTPRKAWIVHFSDRWQWQTLALPLRRAGRSGR